MNIITAFLMGLVVAIGIIGCGEASQNSDVVATQPGAGNKDHAESEQHVQELEVPAKVQPEHGYAKPGAAITFSHDYDGETDPGVRETFVLNIKPSYESGAIDVELSASEGLDLLVDSLQSAEMFGDVIAVPIEVYAENAGQYRLSVVASVGENPLMRSMRAYALTINVGSVDTISLQKAESQTLDANGEAVISLTAEETIQ